MIPHEILNFIFIALKFLHFITKILKDFPDSHPHLYHKLKFPGQINWNFWSVLWSLKKNETTTHKQNKKCSMLKSRTSRKHIIKRIIHRVIEQENIESNFFFSLLKKFWNWQNWNYILFDPTKSHFKILFAVNILWFSIQ